MHHLHLHLRRLVVLVLVVPQLLATTVLGMPATPKGKNDDHSSKAARTNTQSPQQSSMGVPQWPYLLAALTGVGWTAHQALRDRRPHRVGKWDYYASMDAVKEELDDDGEIYVDLTRECVNEKFDKTFPRKGFTLEDVFEDAKMSVAQRRQAIGLVNDCVEVTNQRIAMDKGRSSKHLAGSSTVNEEDGEPLKKPSKDDNYFGFINRVGRGISNAEKNMAKMIPHGSFGRAKMLPGSLPMGRVLAY